jgi:hypothetical protein
MAKEMKWLYETIKEQASIIETLSTKIEALSPRPLEWYILAPWHFLA